MPKPFQKTCTVHIRPEAFFVFSELRTDYGHVAVVPASRVARIADSITVGKAIITALFHSEDVPGEFDLRQSSIDYKEYLKSVGFRSWTAFEKHAFSIHVTETNDWIKLQLWEKQGQAFVPSNYPVVECQPEPSAIGTLICQIISQEN